MILRGSVDELAVECEGSWSGRGSGSTEAIVGKGGRAGQEVKEGEVVFSKKARGLNQNVK